MRLRRGFLPVLAVLAATFSMLGCGSSDSGSERELEGEPFTSDELRDWTAVLADIDTLNADGECDDADSKLATLREAVELSESDEGLKTDLVSLLDDLDSQLAGECAAEPAETSSTSSSTDEIESIPTTPEVETTEEEPETTEEEPETVEDEPAEPSTTTPEQTTSPPITPPGQGGVPPGQEGGISPGSFEPERKGIGER